MGARSVQPRVPAAGPPGLSLAEPRPRSRGVLRLLAAACLFTCAPPGDASVRADQDDGPRPSVAQPPMHPEPTPVLAAVVHAPRPEPPPPPSRTAPLEMTFVGDVILGRYRDDGYDPIPDGEHEPFAEVGELLRSDFVVGNLETPLVRTLPDASPVGTRYSFGADAALAEHLVPAGFHALSLANNHALDLRAEGVEQTPEILAELGIVGVGAARFDAPRLRVETIEREGWRVGLLAVTTEANIPSLTGVPPQPLLELSDIEHELVPLVADARVEHDLVIVLVHWGVEYADEPDWAQRKAAHALVEAGADLVIGHHPHVLQGIERHGHGLIAYSLGNFLFENVKDVPRQTGVLRVRYDERGCMERVVLHPVFVKSVPIKHPAPATGYMGQQVKERVRTLGQPLGSSFRDEGDDLVLEGAGCPPAGAAAGPAPAAAMAGP